jgi:hypothetical protein
MISEKDFIERIKNMPKTIWSKSGSASYTAFELKDDKLIFQRTNTRKFWELSVKQLFEIYRKNKFINTTVVKRTTGGRVNSPSVAILMAIGCLDEKGNRL